MSDKVWYRTNVWQDSMHSGWITRHSENARPRSGRGSVWEDWRDYSRETPFPEIVRCPGDCRCRTLPRCWRVGRNEIADVCRGRCWSGACLLPVRWHCRGRHRCRCGLPCVAHRCPRQPWRRWRRCQGPALPSSLGAFAGGGGVSCVASRTSQRLSAGRCWACARWVPLRGLAVEQPPGCCFLRSRSILQHIETEASRPATPVTSSRSLFQKEKHPETPATPFAAVAVPRRESRVVPVAVPPGGRAGRHGQQCRPTASVAYSRVRSASCKIHSSTERD